MREQTHEDDSPANRPLVVHHPRARALPLGTARPRLPPPRRLEAVPVVVVERAARRRSRRRGRDVPSAGELAWPGGDGSAAVSLVPGRDDLSPRVFERFVALAERVLVRLELDAVAPVVPGSAFVPCALRSTLGRQARAGRAGNPTRIAAVREGTCPDGAQHGVDVEQWILDAGLPFVVVVLLLPPVERALLPLARHARFASGARASSL